MARIWLTKQNKRGIASICSSCRVREVFGFIWRADEFGWKILYDSQFMFQYTYFVVKHKNAAFSVHKLLACLYETQLQKTN